MSTFARTERPEWHQSSTPSLAAAEAATAAKDWVRAGALWEELCGHFPHDPQYWAKAGEAYSAASMFEKAEQLLGEAAARFPDDVWVGYWRAINARRAGNWAEALQRSEKLIETAPDFWPAWVESADALNALGYRAEANTRRQEAGDRFPNEYWPSYGIARAEASASAAEEAVRIWSELLERFPAQPTAVQELEAANRRLSQRGADRSSGTGPMSSSRKGGSSIVLPVSDFEYRCPVDLRVTDARPRRVMVIGSCLSTSWPQILENRYPGCIAEHFLVNNATVLPEETPHPPGEYDFHVVQIHLRKLMREHEHFDLSNSDPADFERLFDTVRERLSEALAEYMRWNQAHGILTFVCNFLAPQQNPMGRLLPRYDLRNFVYFIEKLNEALGQELHQYKNAYLFDLDQIVSTYGRRWMQDDAVWILTHGAALSASDWEEDRNRLEPVEKVTAYYPMQTHDFVLHIWTELLAMYRTIRQTDMVKLVLVDLDDTLWRGVAAEEAEVSSVSREGWPLGFVEALMFLKRRGILLGVVSKNDEEHVLKLWGQIYGDLIRPEDFAVRKINWQPKADNIEEILAEVNLLPKSVVFIDDNPVERAAVKAAFPDMRVLGPNPYLWRRILLWAPETQVATITAESAARTEMVQKQVERETQRKRLSRAEFLASLEVRASLSEIASTSDSRFARAIELINKTNQFNTTGKRWTQQEISGFLRDRGRCFVLEVTDRFTTYGIVGVLLVRGNDITQFVMSCRVVGMDVEIAAVAGVLEALAARGAVECGASLVHTSANLLCRDLWERCGFFAIEAENYHRASDLALAVPPHITLQLDIAEQPALSAAE